MMAMDRGRVPGRGFGVQAVHPLTPAAAGVLLREPRLGAGVPSRYLRSPHKIAVGQRFYILEPVSAATLAMPAVPAGAAAGRLRPSRTWTRVHARRGEVSVGIYLSEADAQRVASALRQGQGGAVLLQTLASLMGAFSNRSAGLHMESEEESEAFAPRRHRHHLPQAIRMVLRRKLRQWVLQALARWVRDHSEAFLRAAAHPDPGVTLRVHLAGIPGLVPAPGTSPAATLAAFRGTPRTAITVAPGTRKP